MVGGLAPWCSGGSGLWVARPPSRTRLHVGPRGTRHVGRQERGGRDTEGGGRADVGRQPDTLVDVRVDDGGARQANVPDSHVEDNQENTRDTKEEQDGAQPEGAQGARWVEALEREPVEARGAARRVGRCRGHAALGCMDGLVRLVLGWVAGVDGEEGE